MTPVGPVGLAGASFFSAGVLQMLFLHPNEFHTDQRADYSVIDRAAAGERKVGRIYYGVGIKGDKWMWEISDWGCAQADDLEDAKQKLKRQYELLGNKPPWP